MGRLGVPPACRIPFWLSGQHSLARRRQTSPCMLCRYNEQEGYPEYVMLIYDGLHYDALAVSAFEGAPEDMDITVMQVSSRAGYGVHQLAQPLEQGECPAPRRVGACVASSRCTQLLLTSCMQSDVKSGALCCVCLAYAPQIGSSDANAAATGAEQLVAACHQARQFTDIANFTLRCGVCQIGLKGEKEAVEHAKATGHQNFAEY